MSDLHFHFPRPKVCQWYPYEYVNDAFIIYCQQGDIIYIKLIANMQAVYILLYMLLSAVFIVCIDSFSNNNNLPNNQQYFIANHNQHITRQSTFRNFASTDDIDSNHIATQNRLLVFGLGNVGSLVAERVTSLQVDDMPFFEHVYGTTRTTKDIVCVQTIGFDDCQE